MYGVNRASLADIHRRGRLSPAFWDETHLSRWEHGQFVDEDHVMGFLNTNSTHVNCAQFMAYPGNPARPWSQAFGKDRVYRGIVSIHHLDNVRARSPEPPGGMRRGLISTACLCEAIRQLLADGGNDAPSLSPNPTGRRRSRWR